MVGGSEGLLGVWSHLHTYRPIIHPHSQRHINTVLVWSHHRKHAVSIPIIFVFSEWFIINNIIYLLLKKEVSLNHQENKGTQKTTVLSQRNNDSISGRNENYKHSERMFSLLTPRPPHSHFLSQDQFLTASMQSTTNYLWLISDLLGQGATANVYRGRHKVRTYHADWGYFYVFGDRAGAVISAMCTHE